MNEQKIDLILFALKELLIDPNGMDKTLRERLAAKITNTLMYKEEKSAEEKQQELTKDAFSEDKENNNHPTKQTFQRESGDNRLVNEDRPSGSPQAVKTGDDTLSEQTEVKG